MSKSTRTKPQILILGAGISGLSAARILTDRGLKVTIVEARDRAGGRIHTNHDLGTPVDMGAAWIHGISRNPIYDLCRKNSIAMMPTNYSNSVLLDDNGKCASAISKLLFSTRANRILPRLARLSRSLSSDICVEDAIEIIIEESAMSKPELCFLNRQLIEFEAMNGSSLKEQSLFALTKEYDSFRGGDRLFPSGFSQLIDRLSQRIDIKYGKIVARIKHSSRHVIFETEQEAFEADAAVITLPLGVLKAKRVEFSPALPIYMQKSIDIIPIGSFNKIAMRFPERFWHNDCDLIELIPQTRTITCQFINWHRYTEQPVLIACLAADTSRKWELKTDDEQQQLIMSVLRQYFGNSIPAPSQVCISRWGQDPFTLGAYSTVAPGAEARDFEALGINVGRLFFAGEATSLEGQGTTHGAYLSGVKAAKTVIASFN